MPTRHIRLVAVPFDFKDLDAAVREHMESEFNLDLSSGNLYLGPRLTPAGVAAWPNLLLEAIHTGNEQQLTSALGAVGGPYLHAVESATGKKTPRNAAAVLAESEFNRFYIRAVCQRSLVLGRPVEVYRARSSSSPDAASEQKIGARPDASELLADLRSSTGIATALGLPPHPNSGLSIRIAR